jgi:hypothetical protein
MEKITKKEALKRFEQRQPLIFCPSKFYPAMNHSFCMAVEISHKCAFDETDSLDKRIDSFSYYNCSKETGLRVTIYKP